MIDVDVVAAQLMMIIKTAMAVNDAKLDALRLELLARPTSPGPPGPPGPPGEPGPPADPLPPPRLELAQDPDDPRVVRVKCGTDETILHFPVPLYHGVYVERRAYEPGDFVTWQSALWYCRTATTARPKSDSSWLLAVKP